ncbi:helix-turn-helix transcriptional regulator [Frankia sp. Cr1]|uniref:helix-turn-helix transcriptional regulator n=1 Tax=Frankia sp. Cr1 TaxID=3073931 RepID=UPI002AD52440|nr:helix-turn-helix transcriptional regulator [Frankia sp. Cr1]
MAPQVDLQLAVHELTNLGLIHSADGWMTVVPYHRAVDAILSEQARIIGQAAECGREAQRRLQILIRESTWLGGDSAGTVLATSVGEEDAARYASGPSARPRASLAAIHPGARFSHEVLDNSVRRAEEDLSAGIRLRVVHQSAALSHPRFAEYLHRLEQLGGQVRLRDNLPFRLIVIDGELAVCCLQWQDGLTETLLLQGARMLCLLGQLFETIWVDSVPLGMAPDGCSAAAEMEDTGPVPALTSQHKAIVRYLADGATDRAIAHSLGITTRTVTRRINEIYQALGAQSRFQAGATARRIGII